MGDEKRALEVDVDDAVPRRLAELEEGDDRFDGCVCHRDVDTAPAPVDRVETVADRAGVRHVHLEGPRLRTPDAPRGGLGGPRVDVGDGDLRPLAREGERDRLADAASSPRHERHLAAEHHRSGGRETGSTPWVA